MFFATGRNRGELLWQLTKTPVIHHEMVARVISNLKPIAMQLRDFLPGHVVRFVGRKVESLRDEKRRAKSVLE